MKIAIFRTDAQVQDLNTYNSQELGLASGLKALGHTVDVYLTAGPETKKNFEAEAVEPGIRVIRVNYLVIPMLNEPVYPGIRKQFKQEGYDLVQINEEGNIATVMLCRICSSMGMRFLIYQGMYRVLSGRKWKYYEWLHNKIFRPYIRERAAAVICKTQQASHFLENRGYLNTHVLPVGLDFSRFNQRVDHDWRATLNIGPDARIVLYVGSLEDRRNPDFMISLARAAGEQTFFLIVGSGPWESRVAAASADIENLIYIGTLNQKELPSLYEQSDVFILPSNYEIYGMVVIESLYFGTPVVSSRTAGPTDILETETFGTILDTLDVEGWLAAIGRTELKSGSDAGAHERSQYASQKFDWRNIATRYIDIVENPERSVR